MRFKIELDILETNIYVFVGEKEWKSFVKGTGVKKTMEEDIYGFVFGNSVWFREEKPDINTIIHESCHLQYEILKHKGIEDEEMKSYTTAFIAGKIINKLGVNK